MDRMSGLASVKLKVRGRSLVGIGAPAGVATESSIAGMGRGGMSSVSQPLKLKFVTAGELLYRLCPFFVGCAGVEGGGGVVEPEGWMDGRGRFSTKGAAIGIDGRRTGRVGTAGAGDGWTMKDMRIGPGVRISGSLHLGSRGAMLKLRALARRFSESSSLDGWSDMRLMTFSNALECFEIRLELETPSIGFFFLSFVAEVSCAVSGIVDIATWDSAPLSAENSLSFGNGRVLTSEPNVDGESSFDTAGDASTIEADRKGSSTTAPKCTSSSERSVH